MDRKRLSSSLSSAAIIGGHDDLLMEILLFLPAKSLIRFQLVSKHWRSLIVGPRFCHLHTLRHRRRLRTQPSFLLRSTYTAEFFIFQPTKEKLVQFRFRYAYLKILQCCNGLLLVQCRNSSHGCKDYFICNPITSKYRKLSLKEGFSGLCLAFDPSTSPYYKVYCFRSTEYFDSLEVYDSKTHTWKDGGKTRSVPRKIFNGVYWNDGICFMRPGKKSYFFFIEGNRNKIYDFESIPRRRSPGAKKNHVMESNGHLHYVVLSLQPDNNYVRVFEAIEDDCSWFIMDEAKLNAISAEFAEKNGRAISLLGMLRGEKEEASLLFHVPGKIMVYRFCDQVFEVLIDFTTEYYFVEGQLQFEFKDAHQLLDTLAPV